MLGSGVLSAVGAGASEQPGSGLLGYTLSAQSSGLQVIEDRPDATTHPEGDGEVPQSVATLVSGPVGYALSSVAWPGALAGNAGSLLVLAGVPLPPDVAAALNDPVRAETRTGGPSDVRNDEVNGASMHASVVRFVAVLFLEWGLLAALVHRAGYRHGAFVYLSKDFLTSETFRAAVVEALRL